MSDDPLSAYRAMLRAGELLRDPAQELAAEKLNLLHRRLRNYQPPDAPRGGFFGRFGFGRDAAPAPPGLYLVGGVGRGKSMMMDMFFDTAPVARKRRVHFHAFMLEVRGRIDDWRRAGRETRMRIGADPIPPVARALTDAAWLLCFDEFQVVDPADALILDRLFSALFDNGVVVVATSNTWPDDLYADGLNRDRFTPFIARLKDRLDVMELDTGVDYRRRLINRMPVYHVAGDGAAALDAAFATLTGGRPGTPETLDVSGRQVPVPAAAAGVARFTFADLCEQPLGAADYIAIAETYHTVVLAGVPRLGPESRSAAARFALLIDALYEHRVKLICAAAAEPDALYPAGHGADAFERTASRLYEMQSEAYLALAHMA